MVQVATGVLLRGVWLWCIVAKLVAFVALPHELDYGYVV